MQETACNAGDVGLIPRPERSPEKEEATCSNILAWEMPWTEEPGSYSPWGARVRYDLVTKPPPPCRTYKELQNLNNKKKFKN